MSLRKFMSAAFLSFAVLLTALSACAFAQSSPEEQLRIVIERFTTSMTALSRALDNPDTEDLSAQDRTALKKILRDRTSVIHYLESTASKLDAEAPRSGPAPCAEPPCLVTTGQTRIIRRALRVLNRRSVKKHLTSLQAALMPFANRGKIVAGPVAALSAIILIVDDAAAKRGKTT